MLEINTVKGQLSTHTTNAKLNIQQPPADFEMHTKQVKVIIEKEPLQIRIDQSQCFNESGLMNNGALRDSFLAEAQQALQEGIGRRVSEGNQLAATGSGQDMIAEIAYNNSFDIKEYDLGTMPRSRPEIDFVGGTMDIKVDEGFATTNSKPNAPRIDYQAGNVETTLSQKPSISIRYVGENIDKSV